MVLECDLQHNPNKLEGIWGHNMEGSAKLINHEVPDLEKSDYFGWRSKMKSYLKQFIVWEIVVNPPKGPSKKTKEIVWKENKIALKVLINGLLSSIKESIGKYTSAKDLRFKLEEEHQRRSQDKEKESDDNSTKDENK